MLISVERVRTCDFCIFPKLFQWMDRTVPPSRGRPAAPFTPAVQYLFAADTPLEASEDTALMMHEIQELVLGTEIKLGVHCMLAVEAVGFGERHWWREVPDLDPAAVPGHSFWLKVRTPFSAGPP